MLPFEVFRHTRSHYKILKLGSELVKGIVHCRQAPRIVMSDTNRFPCVFFQAQPFLLEVFAKKSDSALEIFGVSNGGKPLENALLDSIKISSTAKQMRGNKDVFLFTHENVQRTTIAVENKVSVHY